MPGQRLGRQVHQHGVLHGGGDGQPAAEFVGGPAQNLLGGCVRQFHRGCSATAASSAPLRSGGDHVVAPSGATGVEPGAGVDERPAMPMNRTANTRLQSRQLQAPCESSCGQRLVSPQYGQYCAGARFSAHLVRSPAHTRASSSARCTHWANRSPVFPLRVEGLDDALDVIGQIVAGHLVAADLPAEAGIQAEAAAEVHLEALDLLRRRASVTIMPLSPMSAIWVRAQAFGQPLMLMVSGTSRSPIRCLQLVDQRDARGPWSRRWRACRTPGRCRPSCCAGRWTA